MVDRMLTKFDVALVGGGLQNGLIALALRRRQPDLDLCIVERDRHLAGNHTWCFHAADVAAGDEEIIASLVEQSWPDYSVRFPRHGRQLKSRYSMISSDRLHEAVCDSLRERPSCVVATGENAEAIHAQHIVLASGRVLQAQLIIDSRGPERRELAPGKAGFQKFVGLEVRTHSPHGLESPILMDAQVEQVDGFRFLYVLPLGPDRLLLEDTRFSDGPALDVEDLTSRIHEYARQQGYRIAEVLRTEQGVLPLPWAGEIVDHVAGEPIRAGYAGSWFHPVTGYSFPIALRLASYIANAPLDLLQRDGLNELLPEHRRQMAFAYRLNKMLFTWFEPDKRYNVLERFYTLHEPIIRRFYALQTTGIDRARIFLGRPPRGMSYKAAILGKSVS